MHKSIDVYLGMAVAAALFVLSVPVKADNRFELNNAGNFQIHVQVSNTDPDGELKMVPYGGMNIRQDGNNTYWRYMEKFTHIDFCHMLPPELDIEIGEAHTVGSGTVDSAAIPTFTQAETTDGEQRQLPSWANYIVRIAPPADAFDGMCYFDVYMWGYDEIN